MFVEYLRQIKINNIQYIVASEPASSPDRMIDLL